jgi:hypothetical protein
MANTYWQQTAHSLARQIERAGLPKETIEAELRAFFDAVQAELCRMASQHNDGGVA